MNSGLLEVKVAAKTMLAKDIAGFELVHADGSSLPGFTAGSHIDVHLGDGLIRQYSLWNDPSESHRYCLGVLKEEAGRGGSAAMHELTVGATLSISVPRNNFELNDSAKHSLLLAGGIGITPILGMAQALHERGESFALHYCARSPERMAFKGMVKLSGFAENAHLHFDNGPAKQKFDIDALRQPPEEGTHLYVCGPTGFMDAVLASASDAWPASSLHREYFTADLQAVDGEDRPFQIKLDSTGDVLDVPADRTIVEVLADAGIEIPTSCEQGICGTCLTPVLQGTPDHRDLVLTEEEHADNDQMTLCCSRALTDLLVLDL
ncbi:PDR/VanB family oxidoreductase [Primorskyibacter marinus]|uniref:PDR/VanB family oxidoreductase n=1 Tax=Primorskyibacter marinus TaxID=1977320 RepID=UPI000E2FF69C|nr:PDR/VanB family oxidoreductase [Primorskyibacter marinus]